MSSSTKKIEFESPMISSTIASKLAITFVENILFLKNQIPFPVAQLGRLPTARSDKRSAKQRQDLLESFDLLCSHLETTFSALSTSIARCKQRPDTTPAYLLVLLGPTVSPSAAKAKLVLAIDAMDVTVWGERDNLMKPAKDGIPAEDSESEEEESDEYDSDDDLGEENDEDEDDESSSSPTSSEFGDVDDSGSAISSPLPSPLPKPRVAPVAHPPLSAISPEVKLTRLLARTLTAGLDDGDGVGDDLAPTQTHVLILAPRRFSHPAWVPRQQFGSGKGLGRGVLDDFWQACATEGDESDAQDNETQKRKFTKKIPTKGVWVHSDHDGQPLPPPTSDDGEAEESPDEEDEMIWWSWDGKIVGFSNW